MIHHATSNVNKHFLQKTPTFWKHVKPTESSYDMIFCDFIYIPLCPSCVSTTIPVSRARNENEKRRSANFFLSFSIILHRQCESAHVGDREGMLVSSKHIKQKGYILVLLIFPLCILNRDARGREGRKKIVKLSSLASRPFFVFNLSCLYFFTSPL